MTQFKYKDASYKMKQLYDKLNWIDQIEYEPERTKKHNFCIMSICRESLRYGATKQEIAELILKNFQ